MHTAGVINKRTLTFGADVRRKASGKSINIGCSHTLSAVAYAIGIFFSKLSGTIDEFNYVAYADRYPDLRDVFGYDKEALYEHYITCGINEKRIAVSY